MSIILHNTCKKINDYPILNSPSLSPLLYSSVSHPSFFLMQGTPLIISVVKPSFAAFLVFASLSCFLPFVFASPAILFRVHPSLSSFFLCFCFFVGKFFLTRTPLCSFLLFSLLLSSLFVSICSLLTLLLPFFSYAFS